MSEPKTLRDFLGRGGGDYYCECVACCLITLHDLASHECVRCGQMCCMPGDSPCPYHVEEAMDRGEWFKS